jgi:hypothetical protein
VDDLDEQVQLFDIRAGGFNIQPVVRFGHRAQTTRPARHSSPSYRYTRGSLSHCYFTRGFADGYVFVWDFRNPKVGTFYVLVFCRDTGSLTPNLETQKIAVKLESRVGKLDVVHTAISGLDVAAFSTGVVTVYKQVL